jgi:glycosyltransferase involved in cell wall biosynthesis
MRTVESESTTNQPQPGAAQPSARENPGTTRTLHVLTLTPFYPAAGDDASGCFIAEPLRELALCNIASTVVAARPFHHSRQFSNEFAPARWVRYPQLPGNFGLSSAGRFLFMRLLRSVKALHQQHAIDLIHAHAALPCGDAAALLSRALDVPFVVTVHGLDVFNKSLRSGMGVRWRHEVSAEVYRHAGRVICISKRVEQLLAYGMSHPVRSTVVYNGTDTELFSPSPSREQSEPTVLAVGNLLPSKGHELVVNAISRLQGRHTGLRCRVVGDGPERERLAALANKLGIEQKIEFLGRRSRSQVADEMRNCTVFVLPSRYEGLGCVYLEAMSCGKPVVACHEQGIEEIIRHGENGWLIPVDGLDALVEGLSTLLDSAELRARLGQAARETILNGLTLQHQAQKLAKIYNEVVR